MMARWILGSLMVAVACSAPHDDAPAVIRDSAGVRIVASSRSVWTGATGRWSVDTVPFLSIGSSDGEEIYQFHRIGGAEKMGDGRILVGNAGTGEVRIFDSTGRFIRRFGRQGAGPGEFDQFSSLELWAGPGGIVLVEDGGNLRVNVYDSGGAFRHAIRLVPPPPAGRASAHGVFADGSLLGMAPFGALQAPPGALVQPTISYDRYDTTGAVLNRVAAVPSRPRIVHEYGAITHYPFVPLSAEPLVAAGLDHVALVRGAAPEVELRALDGRLRSIFRWRPKISRVTDIWERFRTADLASNPDTAQRRTYEHFYAMALPLPEFTPAARSLLIDSEGNLWFDRYRLPWDVYPTWDVLTPDGTWLGAVELPIGLRPFEIGPDYVLGRWRDSLGVEYLRMHRLRR